MLKRFGRTGVLLLPLCLAMAAAPLACGGDDHPHEGVPTESVCPTTQTLTYDNFGSAVGVPIALVATRAVSSQLYGVSPADPLVCVTAILTLTITAIAACYFPARGATRVDPLVTLRN